MKSSTFCLPNVMGWELRGRLNWWGYNFAIMVSLICVRFHPVIISFHLHSFCLKVECTLLLLSWYLFCYSTLLLTFPLISSIFSFSLHYCSLASLLGFEFHFHFVEQLLDFISQLYLIIFSFLLPSSAFISLFLHGISGHSLFYHTATLPAFFFLHTFLPHALDNNHTQDNDLLCD